MLIYAQLDAKLSGILDEKIAMHTCMENIGIFGVAA